MEDIRKVIPIFDMDGINNTTTLTTNDGVKGIREVACEIIDSIKTSNSEAFEQFKGNLTTNPFLEKPSESTFKAGAYAVQLNYKTLKGTEADKVTTIDKLITNLTTDLGSDLGMQVFTDLLMDAAFNSSNQTAVTDQIANKNQYTIYDINAKNALGNK